MMWHELFPADNHGLWKQARNLGAQGSKAPLKKFSPALEKYVGHNLKLLGIVYKIWVPLRKLFVFPGVPSWLQAWSEGGSGI